MKNGATKIYFSTEEYLNLRENSIQEQKRARPIFLLNQGLTVVIKGNGRTHWFFSIDFFMFSYLRPLFGTKKPKTLTKPNVEIELWPFLKWSF